MIPLTRLRAVALACSTAGFLPPAVAQEAFPRAEAGALRLAGRGDAWAAQQAFIALLRATESDELAAARAEYYAAEAFELARVTGEWSELEAACRAIVDGLGAAHPTLSDKMKLVQLQIALQRGDAAATAQRTATLGFIEDWWLIGPFDNERGAGLERSYGPERELDLDASYDGKKRLVQWRRLPVPSTAGGHVDLDAMTRPSDQVLSYAVTSLWSERDQVVTLNLGSDEAFAVFLNGSRVAQRDVRRSFARDQEAIALSLREGPNLLLLKICDQEGGFGFAARLSARRGGSAVAVAVRADREALERAATTAPAESPVEPPFDGARTVLAHSAEDRASAVDAFRLASILLRSQPDDPSERRDHQLALRAAAELPGEPAVRDLLARTRIRPGASAAEKDDNARRHDYLAILEDHPEHARTSVALARMDLDSIGAAQSAEQLARRALATNPEFVEARLTLARALRELDLDVLADREIERACAGHQGRAPHPEAQRELARALASRGDLRGAIALLARAQTRAFTIDTALRLAELQMQTGARDDAVRTLQHATQVRPFAERPRKKLARLFEAEEQLDRALTELRAWLAISPEDDDTMVLIAHVYGLAGDAEREREWLRSALELNPNLKDQRRLLDFLEDEENPFYSGYEIDAATVLAADTGPPTGYRRAQRPLRAPATTAGRPRLPQRDHQRVPALDHSHPERGRRAPDEHPPRRALPRRAAGAPAGRPRRQGGRPRAAAQDLRLGGSAATARTGRHRRDAQSSRRHRAVVLRRLLRARTPLQPPRRRAEPTILPDRGAGPGTRLQHAAGERGTGARNLRGPGRSDDPSLRADRHPAPGSRSAHTHLARIRAAGADFDLPGLGPFQRVVVELDPQADRGFGRDARQGRGADLRPHYRESKDRRDLRLRDHRDPLHGLGVRRPRLPALHHPGDLRSPPRRLQRQVPAAQRDARRARHRGPSGADPRVRGCAAGTTCRCR